MEVSISCPSCLTPMGRASRTLCTGGWVGPQDQNGCSDEEKNLCPCQKFTLVIHPVASHYTILQYLVIKNEISDIILNLTISTTVLLIHLQPSYWLPIILIAFWNKKLRQIPGYLLLLHKSKQIHTESSSHNRY